VPVKLPVQPAPAVQLRPDRQQGLQPEYFLGLDTLKIVKTYKYLGLDFEDTLRWTLTRQRLVAKAKGRLAMLSKALSEGLSMKAAEVIWWSMIVPVLNFGSELWGAAKCKEIEMVQLEVGRRVRGEPAGGPCAAGHEITLVLGTAG